MCQGLEFREKMNCLLLWETMLGEAGHDSQEDTLMPQRTLISGSLKKGLMKRLTEGQREGLWPLVGLLRPHFIVTWKIQEIRERWLPLKGLTCQLNQKQANIK